MISPNSSVAISISCSPPRSGKSAPRNWPRRFRNLFSLLSRGTRAKVLAQRGAFADAEQCAQEAVQFVEDTDALDLHGTALLDLAEVLLAAGRYEEGAARAEEALRLFEEKENEVSADRARALMGVAQPPVTASEDPGDRSS